MVLITASLTVKMMAEASSLMIPSKIIVILLMDSLLEMEMHPLVVEYSVFIPLQLSPTAQLLEIKLSMVVESAASVAPHLLPTAQLLEIRLFTAVVESTAGTLLPPLLIAQLRKIELPGVVEFPLPARHLPQLSPTAQLLEI